MLDIEIADRNDMLTAYRSIPYSLINGEFKNGTLANEYLAELSTIKKFYNIYRNGADFPTEGTHSDYVPANLKYKMASSLINKEARFLFGETPDIGMKISNDITMITPEMKKELGKWNALLRKVLKHNHFEDALLKAAKDAFIGKRVAGLVNFNTTEGITITFLSSLNFMFECKDNDINNLTKFVGFQIITNSTSEREKRIYKKKYEKLYDERYGKDIVILNEGIYDGVGTLIEEMATNIIIELDRIPAFVILNDGLTSDLSGESEIELLKEYELWYSRLASADIDSERKSMNPTKYTIDMDGNSTKDLSTGAGAFWDLMSDQNLENPNPSVGILESGMNYSDTLKTSLDRIKTVGYEQIDMPNITLESMQGAITSGKSLKAIYWPLIVRCKEKMKMWGPKLEEMVNIIYDGAIKYPMVAKFEIDEELIPIPHEIEIIQNFPLPEDEDEEKVLDMQEVNSNVMSRKAYMKKWRYLSDEEIDSELKQMAYERQILEDAAFDLNSVSDDNGV